MKIAIIGTGVYSTALTYHLQKLKENSICLWTENLKLAQKFQKKKKFDFLSKDLIYNDNVRLSTSLEETINQADILFILVGSKYYEKTIQEIKPYYDKKIPIFVGTKGMNLETCTFFSDLTRKQLKCNSYSYFAGPTFAKDLTTEDNFSFTIAGSNKLGFIKFQTLWPSNIKFEFTRDLYGLEIMSVLKNIYAIGSGIIKGLDCSESSYYTFITDIIKETKTIIKKWSGFEETILTYGGIGDFLLTSHSKKSRNFTLGKMIGTKTNKKEIVEYQQNTTIEGLESLNNIENFIKKTKLENSIVETIYQIVIQEQNPEILTKK